MRLIRSLHISLWLLFKSRQEKETQRPRNSSGMCWSGPDRQGGAVDEGDNDGESRMGLVDLKVSSVAIN